MKLLQLILITLLLSITLVKAQNNTRITSYYDINDKKSYYLAWDTKTGKSIQYYWNGSDHKYNAFEINLPAAPLPGNTGEVMIKTYYDNNDGKAYYIVYDTNGGKSIQYYWNGSDHKYDAFEINLPAQPLLGK